MNAKLGRLCRSFVHILRNRFYITFALLVFGILSLLLPSLVLAQAESTATPTSAESTVVLDPTQDPADPTPADATPLPSLASTPLSTPVPADFQPLDPGLLITTTQTITPTFAADFPFVILSTPLPPPVTYLFCNYPGIGIPDNNTDGLSNQIAVNQPGVVVDLNVYVKIDHSWVGDLQAVLDHTSYSDRYVLFDRPGVPGSPEGCTSNNLQAIFDDDALRPAEDRCNYSTVGPGVGGIFQPVDPLSHFIGQPATGGWWLNVFDLSAGDTGSLQQWCLEMTVGVDLPLITPTPTPVVLPASKYLNVGGQNQIMPLDCESRSAVDFAAYFGKYIDETGFFNHLPHSDDPDAGFVGNVYGTWGQIPPNAYGVHAQPIAKALNDYGVTAVARRPLGWDGLRAEIAAGRPVIVWVVPRVVSSIPNLGAPQFYTAASNQHRSIVASYEHTVMVTGYDANYIYIRDGGKTYSRTIDEFIDMWSPLDFMAVIKVLILAIQKNAFMLNYAQEKC